ncbi:MAG TPA: hypothetical protein VKV20_00525 [Ktedonobacteraceae bacterium]|nr:hypothetical protein [Ktedonobacteraceae bacterium]
MHITIICIPYQVDVTHWGYANGPQAFLLLTREGIWGNKVFFLLICRL